MGDAELQSCDDGISVAREASDIGQSALANFKLTPPGVTGDHLETGFFNENILISLLQRQHISYTKVAESVSPINKEFIDTHIVPLRGTIVPLQSKEKNSV